ncbi:MAG: hypothetical protein Q7S32_01965 [bacterium]|nr:hypothetical protein [bacterium]
MNGPMQSNMEDRIAKLESESEELEKYRKFWEVQWPETLRMFRSAQRGLVVGAVIALGVAVWHLKRLGESVQATEDAAKRQLVSSLVTEYASPDMGKAMRELHRFSEKCLRSGVSRAAAEFIRQVSEGTGDELDDWRRLTYRYFHKVRLFAEDGVIDSSLLAHIFKPVAVRFVVEVLQPLTEAHGDRITGVDYDRATFEFFESL